MELNDFIQHFVDLLDETDSSEIKATTEFKALDEWSSLIALSIIAMADEEYDVTLKSDDLKAATTIEDLFKTVEAKR